MENRIEFKVEGFSATLNCYLTNSTTPVGAILICPGGGYGIVSQREGLPIAKTFVNMGYNAYVLTYSTVKNVPTVRYPIQLHQGFYALNYIFNNASAHNTDPNNVNICGFSAGGHLAANIAIDYTHTSNKVNRMILSYPVITYGEFAHNGSFNNLTGGDETLCKELSLEHCINKDTPPAFIWHTSNDDVVDVRNSLLFASALRANNILFELHIYPSGIHGLSLATEETMDNDSHMIQPDCAEWIYLADKFLKKSL